MRVKNIELELSWIVERERSMKLVTLLVSSDKECYTDVPKCTQTKRKSFYVG